jgi:coenzyme F420-reducing hydrogenase alpha subunit
MLHAPDFLGYESAVHMARDHPELVAKALELKKTGNEVMTVVGGREVHPINVRVGGWYRAPRKRELAPLVPKLERAREIALETVGVTAALDFPDYEYDYELVALSPPGEYPIDLGRIASNRGLDIDVREYEEHFVEEHVARSNALHSRLRERGSYLCGPLARFALAYDRLSPLAQEAAAAAGLSPSERNPFRSIVVRAVELVYAADEALRLIAAYEEPDAPAVEVEPRAGVGHGCTEAPRGILYHRYELDADGTILDAKIVPPTSQNQRTIEEDLRGVVERSLDLPDDELALLCEQSIRNYDPCISCATHFLKLEVERC